MHFLPPLYTFTIAAPINVAAFIFFLIVAVLISNLAARVRAQAFTARARARTTEQLYAFSRKLAGVGTLDDVLWATAYQTAAMLRLRVVLLLPDNGSISVKAGYPPEDTLDEADLAAATWAWEHDRPAGRDSDTLPGAKRLFLPMRTGRGAIGVIGIDTDQLGPMLSPDQRRLLDALIDQAALAIERVYLVEDLDKAKRSEEADRLRAALLTSISHDLKTPLASILGSAGALKDLSQELGDAAKAELLQTVIDESERLNRFIANLLDMTKLESGAIKLNPALHDIARLLLPLWRGPAKFSPRIAWRSSSPPTCRCWSWTQCCSNRCWSISWTTPQNTHRQRLWCAFSAGETATRSSCKLQMRAAASRLAILSLSSTSSIAPKKAIK